MLPLDGFRFACFFLWSVCLVFRLAVSPSGSADRVLLRVCLLLVVRQKSLHKAFAGGGFGYFGGDDFANHCAYGDLLWAHLLIATHQKH